MKQIQMINRTVDVKDGWILVNETDAPNSRYVFVIGVEIFYPQPLEITIPHFVIFSPDMLKKVTPFWIKKFSKIYAEMAILDKLQIKWSQDECEIIANNPILDKLTCLSVNIGCFEL